MNFHQVSIFVLSLVFLVSKGSTVHSGFTLEFGFQNVDVVAGNDILVQIFLTQSNGETRLSSTSPQSVKGLGTGAFTLTSSGETTIKSWVFESGFTDDRFTELDPENRNLYVGFLSLNPNRILPDEDDLFQPIFATSRPDSILLGSAIISVAATAAGPYTIGVVAPTGSFILGPSFPEVGFQPGSSTATITAVPEPTSFVLGSLGLVCLLGAACRKRRAAKGIRSDAA